MWDFRSKIQLVKSPVPIPKSVVLELGVVKLSSNHQNKDWYDNNYSR